MEIDYRRVVDALPGLVWTALPDGRIDFLNQRWCEYTGLSVDEAYGPGWQTAIHPEDLPEVRDPFWLLASQVKWKPACGASTEGRIVLWYLLHIDIDDRKRAEALLAGEKQRLEMVVGGL